MSLFKTLTLIFLLLAFKPLFAQEMLGIVNSSYSGITGSVINPAVTVTSPYYLDINLLAGDFFAENNYIYLAKEEYRFSRFFSKNPDYPTHGVNNNLLVYDYYNTKDKKAFANERLIGPSFAVTVGRHSFGIVTGARAFMSTKQVPYDLAKFAFERFALPDEASELYATDFAHSKPIYNAQMAWAEIGINYSYVFKQESRDYWAAGITVKDLLGHSGAYMYSENLNYSVSEIPFKQDTLLTNSLQNLQGEGGYSLPLNYETNEYMKDPLFRGKGIGIDLGVIYQKKKLDVRSERVGKLCSQNYTPYKYKIGVSILDIGRIRFTQNAEKLVFENVLPSYWSDTSDIPIASVRDLTNLLGNKFYNDTTTLIQGNEIEIALPTALSFQADLNYYKNWYINGTFVLPLQISKSGLRRPALLAVAPRYETALFDVSMPISLFDWTEPRIGLSARFMWFFVGTEKLSGFFHYKDFTGLDFYFGAKISLRKGFCRNKSGNNHNKKMGDNCGIEEYKMFRKNK